MWVSRDSLDLMGKIDTPELFSPEHQSAHFRLAHRDILKDTDDMLTTKPASTNLRRCKSYHAYSLSIML